jgi:hypothetical protein
MSNMLILCLASHADFALLTKINELTAVKYNQSATEVEKANEVLNQIFEKRFFFVLFLFCFKRGK